MNIITHVKKNAFSKVSEETNRLELKAGILQLYLLVYVNMLAVHSSTNTIYIYIISTYQLHT